MERNEKHAGTAAAPAAETPVSPAPRRVGRKGLNASVRERVIEAAGEQMAAHGLDGLKVRTIASGAGISVGSVYNLFGDLDKLTRLANASVYDALHDVEAKALDAARENGKPPVEQMLTLSVAYLDFVAANQTRWLAVLAFNRSRSEPPPRWYVEKEIRLFRIIEDVIKDFPGAQNVASRRLHARALWASIHGIVTLAVADGFLMQPVEDVRQQIEIIITAVAARLADGKK